MSSIHYLRDKKWEIMHPTLKQLWPKINFNIQHIAQSVEKLKPGFLPNFVLNTFFAEAQML